MVATLMLNAGYEKWMMEQAKFTKQMQYKVAVSAVPLSAVRALWVCRKAS